jgi:hypothetical protein
MSREQNMNTFGMQAASRKKVRRDPQGRGRDLAASADTPSRAALRLLTALVAPGAEAMTDPTSPEMVIVRAGQGISLGRGSYPAALARDLEAHDLAAGTGPKEARRYVISAVGRAHLKRRETGSDSVFRSQHGEIVSAEIADETGTTRVALNAAESPLDWLRRRRDAAGEPLIDAAAFEAGERLRRDMTFGGMLPSVTARWEGAIGAGAQGPRYPAGATETMIAARQRTRPALEAVGGDFADLLVDLCGFLKGLEAIERERRWPARSAKVVVRLALRRLAQHYGLDAQARGPGASRGIRTWTGLLEEPL